MDVFCDCGRKAALRTSWTNRNPGRRFWACKNIMEGNCGFFAWVDPPMCARSMEVIPGLLRTIRENDARKQMQHRRELVLGSLLLLTWFLIMVVWYYMAEINKSDKGQEEQMRGQLGF